MNIYYNKKNTYYELEPPPPPLWLLPTALGISLIIYHKFLLNPEMHTELWYYDQILETYISH